MMFAATIDCLHFRLLCYVFYFWNKQGLVPKVNNLFEISRNVTKVRGTSLIFQEKSSNTDTKKKNNIILFGIKSKSKHL